MQQAVCGMSVVKDYYNLQKFNVMELAAGVAKDRAAAETTELEPSAPATAELASAQG
jgi:hypothetical protein